MYFNDTHVIFYTITIILGFIIGQFIDYCSQTFLKEKKIFSKTSFLEYKKDIKPNYILMILTAAIYAGLLYKCGINKIVVHNIPLISYIILIPMLIIAFIVDYKIQIIPNRLNLTIFEFGLIFAILYGFININITYGLLMGMLAGGGIFLIITLLGGLIAGKEAMGFGDVKLMGALGLYLGLTNIVLTSVMSFLIGAILSIILIITKVKKTDEYIPFGPFIVIATIICVFVPTNILFNTLMKIFTLGMW